MYINVHVKGVSTLYTSISLEPPLLDARRTEEGCGQEYRCKWKGLPYSKCTWEDGALVMEAHGEKVELFERRMDSDCIPSQSAKVMNIT